VLTQVLVMMSLQLLRCRIPGIPAALTHRLTDCKGRAGSLCRVCAVLAQPPIPAAARSRCDLAYEYMQLGPTL